MNDYFKARNYTLPITDKALIMAIINLTPDSFYSGSRFTGDEAVMHAVDAVNQGADIIDLGAQSTAPGCKSITAAEELERLLPSLDRIRSAVDVPISVDTFYPEVARAALEHGADIVNDVSGEVYEETARLVKDFGAGWIITHTKRTAPYTSAVDDTYEFFTQAKAKALTLGISERQLCFDPGIGFNTTREDDLQLMSQFSKICIEGSAMLAALSRKRVTRLSGDALTGTITSNAVCILGGANIIRVHDVEQAVATAKMAELLRG